MFPEVGRVRGLRTVIHAALLVFKMQNSQQPSVVNCHKLTFMQCVYASTSLKGIIYSPSCCFWPVWLSFLLWAQNAWKAISTIIVTLYVMSLFLELPLSQKYHAIANFYLTITIFFLYLKHFKYILNMLQTVKLNVYWNIFNFNLYIRKFISKCMSGARKHISNLVVYI